ncbi:ATPase, T2SS/T4P/T4SS family [Pseudomonas aeruginosa]
MQINIIGNHFAFMDSAMLLHIPAIFTAEEVSRIRAALEQAEWADGKATAGYQSAKAKHNLQLPQDHPLAREIGEAMLQRLWNHPLFMSAALPLKVFPPLFNCYTGGGSFDFHIDNAVPTLWGEKIVMRILDSSSAQMGIDALGYEEDQKELYLAALKQPQGMILVTGPTGSGKTVSLYTGLNILNTTDINISTAEDPVEINLEGINQVNVNPRQGMDFSQALRAFLRQDPDVIMVGEIRDLETAEIAIKAAQTGHMVMSTLHTNSAAETLTRLLNMGVPAFNLATSVNLIIAQRLARKLCSHCKKEHDVPKETLLHEGFPEELIGTFKLYSPVGCENCKGGYKGRVGIYEVVKNTPALQRIIMEEGNSIEIAEQARKEGFNDLRTSGLLKAMQGITSLEEVNRVTKD